MVEIESKVQRKKKEKGRDIKEKTKDTIYLLLKIFKNHMFLFGL